MEILDQRVRTPDETKPEMLKYFREKNLDPKYILPVSPGDNQGVMDAYTENGGAL